VITQLVKQFEKEKTPAAPRGRGRLFTYTQRLWLVFFLLMHSCRCHAFKAHRRWLETHPEEAKQLGFPALPHRTSLSRRYKELKGWLEDLIAFVGQ
jgi:hypothetical protein